MECRLSRNTISRRCLDAPKRRYFSSCSSIGICSNHRKEILETRLPFRNDGMRFYRVYDARIDALLHMLQIGLVFPWVWRFAQIDMHRYARSVLSKMQGINLLRENLPRVSQDYVESSNVRDLIGSSRRWPGAAIFTENSIDLYPVGYSFDSTRRSSNSKTVSQIFRSIDRTGKYPTVTIFYKDNRASLF